MQLAERLSKLGTETAFAVSAEAAAHLKKGNRVYSDKKIEELANDYPARVLNKIFFEAIVLNGEAGDIDPEEDKKKDKE